jgi:hypothetical protein
MDRIGAPNANVKKYTKARGKWRFFAKLEQNGGAFPSPRHSR